MRSQKTRSIYIALLSLSCVLATNLAAIAGPNDFFGGSIPQQDPAGAAQQAGMSAAQGVPTDYSDDEKRMRKKYKANMESARKLIAKGEAMMKSKKENTVHKDYKKGKILKEIGERRLAELKANSPFPEVAEKNGSSTQ